MIRTTTIRNFGIRFTDAHGVVIGGQNFCQALREASTYRAKGHRVEVVAHMDGGVILNALDVDYAIYLDGKSWILDGDYWSPNF